MTERSKTRITVSFALAVAMIVGFAFAPAVVAADDDTSIDDAGGDVVDVDTGGLDRRVVVCRDDGWGEGEPDYHRYGESERHGYSGFALFSHLYLYIFVLG